MFFTRYPKYQVDNEQITSFFYLLSKWKLTYIPSIWQIFIRLFFIYETKSDSFLNWSIKFDIPPFCQKCKISSVRGSIIRILTRFLLYWFLTKALGPCTRNLGYRRTLYVHRGKASVKGAFFNIFFFSSKHVTVYAKKSIYLYFIPWHEKTLQNMLIFQAENIYALNMLYVMKIAFIKFKK